MEQMKAKQEALKQELSPKRKLNFGADDDGDGDDSDAGTFGGANKMLANAGKSVKFGGDDDDSSLTSTEKHGGEMSAAAIKASGGILKGGKKDPLAEKERIQRQYEAYHAKKKTLDDEAAPDVAKMAESQALQDDIRSLLSTIQTR
jgi:hypothetical protein